MAADKYQFSGMVPLPPPAAACRSAAEIAIGDDRRARFEAAAEAVIAAKRSPATRRAYRYELRSWVAFCDESGVERALATLTAATEYRDDLLEDRSAASTHRACAAMSSVYKQLLRGRAVQANPFHSSVLAWPSATPERPTPAARDDDVRAMLRATRNDRDQWIGARDFAIIALLWHTGLRRSSVAALRIEDFRRDGEDVVLRAMIKGGKHGEVVLVPEAEEALSSWLQIAGITSGPLFPAREGRPEAISGDGLYRVVQRRSREAGVTAHLSPHQLRAALATAGYDAGLPEYEVQAALHHARPETTRRYDRGRRGARALSSVAAARRKAPGG